MSPPNNALLNLSQKLIQTLIICPVVLVLSSANRKQSFILAVSTAEVATVGHMVGFAASPQE